jgi:hypothetical protein
VTVENGVVKYRQNGTLLYTSAIAPRFPLLLDASILSSTGEVNNAAISGHLLDVGTQQPTFNVAAGDYGAAQTVTVTVGTAGAVIHYTLNGTDPTESDATVASGGTVSVSATATLKARAFTTGLYPSRVTAARYTIGLGSATTEPVVWTNVVNATTSDSSLLKNYASSSYDAGATSTRAFDSTDGYLEFQAVAANGQRTAGLSFGDTDATNDDIDYGLVLTGSTVRVIESGVDRGSFGSYAANDVFRVSVENGVVKYRKNGTLLYTSAVAPRYPLLIDASLLTNGVEIRSATISGHLLDVGTQQPVFNVAAGDYATSQTVTVTVGTSGAVIHYTLNGTDPTESDATVASGGTVSVSTTATLKARAFTTGLFPSRVTAARYTIGMGSATTESVAWTNVVNATTSGNTLTKNFATAGYNAGGVSTKGFDSTDGYVEFQAVVINGQRVAGLSFGDTDAVNDDVDFGFFLTGTTMKVMEAGVDRGSLGTYAANDVFRISVENGVVKYRKNGTVIYTSTVAPRYPLLIDASISSNALAINNAAISGHLVDSRLPAPTANPAAGSYDAAVNLALSVPVPGAVIRYTTNGTDPNGGSSVYSAPIALSLGAAVTVKSFATAPGYLDGAIAPATYTFVAQAPVFSPPACPYLGPLFVTATSATSSATIYYTLNGDTPTTGSASVANGGSISIPASATLKAMAASSGLAPSSVTSAAYEVVAATPIITPSGGTYTSSVSVSISPVSGATVHYTTNGDEPTTGSTSYSGSFNVTANATVKAKAFAAGWTPSATATAEFAVKVATPTLSVASGRWYANHKIIASSSTNGATVRYTRDGSEPTDTSTAVPSNGELILIQSQAMRFRAFKTGMTPSDTVNGVYYITGQLAGGSNHSLALKGNGEVWAWGNNGFGQLGDGTTTQRLAPVLVMTDAIEIAAGTSYSAAIKSDGTVWTWGLNTSSQLGRTGTTNVPGQVDMGGLTVAHIAAGGVHMLAVSPAGEVRAWGGNTVAQLGIGGAGASAGTPVAVLQAAATPLTNVATVAAGAYHSLALRTDGTVVAWGANSNGQLGDGTTTTRSFATSTSSLSGVTSIATSSSAESSYAYKASTKQIYGWGNNTNSQLGDGTTTDRHSPIVISTGSREISAGGSHFAFVGTEGRLWGTGFNVQRQLGDMTTTNRMTPVKSRVAETIATTGQGNQHSLAATADGRVWVTGQNLNGQLGLGTGTIPLVPTAIPTPSPGFRLFESFTSGADPDFMMDVDGDGLRLIDEMIAGTDPFNRDTNGNGLDDGAEVDLGYGPTATDTDGDSVSNDAEILAGTDPFKADTDGDGYNDAVDQLPLDPTKHLLSTTPGAPVITLLRPVSAIQIP